MSTYETKRYSMLLERWEDLRLSRQSTSSSSASVVASNGADSDYQSVTIIPSTQDFSPAGHPMFTTHLIRDSSKLRIDQFHNFKDWTNGCPVEFHGSQLADIDTGLDSFINSLPLN